MLKNFFVEQTPVIVFCWAALFILVKTAFIFYFGVKEDVLKVLILSALLVPRQVVKNTFYKPLKNFYSLSNKFNRYYYIISALLLCMIVFMMGL